MEQMNGGPVRNGRKMVTVLGSTGSIGRQALDVIASRSDLFGLFGIAGGGNRELLIEQARRWRPRFVASRLPIDRSLLPDDVRLLCGEHAASELASMAEADVIVNGISGLPALEPLLCALRARKRVALANKESIVCGHDLIDGTVAAYGGSVIPVDSEQSALFQCLSCGRSEEVEKLWLTASGGPFWQYDKEQLKNVTLADALKHPTWNMGRKITVDSASLFNKGLEVIEASYLFHMPVSRIGVLIHPQSVVHSFVEFRDRTCIANMSCPDMRLPIQYAMTYPDREVSPCERLSLAEVSALTFHKADPDRFDALRLAYEAWYAGGTMTSVYNAANEFAVSLFMQEKIRFSDIAPCVEEAMLHHSARPVGDVEDIRDAYRDAEISVAEFARRHEGRGAL